MLGLSDIAAHVRMAFITWRRTARLASNPISVLPCAKGDPVEEPERSPHVGAGGAIVSERRVDRAVAPTLDRQAFVCPSLKGLRVDSVSGMAVQSGPGSRELAFDRLRCVTTIRRPAELAGKERAV